MQRAAPLVGLLLLAGFARTAETAAPAEGAAAAVNRGVRALQALTAQPAEGKKHPVGAIALWGLTLLECDVAASDAGIQNAAAELRTASVDLTHNYSIALAIMFFDRLGDPADAYLIQALGLRMLTGQNHADGWSYQPPPPGADETRRLAAWAKARNDAAKKAGGKPGPAPKQAHALPPELAEQWKQFKARPARLDQGGVGDNSNTQFAVMALWTARRYGVPVDEAMARVNRRFRGCQQADGGWAYVPSKEGEPPTASMTCAGLLGLAMSHGVALEASRRTDSKAGGRPLDPAQDPAIRAGLQALGTAVAGTRAPRGGVLTKGFYFLWSLERVGVAYNLPTIGNVDWYAWGAQLLTASQQPDGCWRGEEGPLVDTCFALLFLRRANLTRDLSATLKNMKDPGQATLKAGGIGGAGLLAKGVTVGLAFGDRPDDVLPAHLDPEAAKVCKELLQAAPERQRELIGRLKDSKGISNTDALTVVAARLNGPVQQEARAALAERLTRMTAPTLRSRLATDEDVELRVAAISAAATKEDPVLVPDLIPLLADAQPRVARAAYLALKHLTRQDFGPPADATPAQRDKAVAAWKSWWQKQAPK